MTSEPSVQQMNIEEFMLTPEEMHKINDAQPPDAKYGDVFKAISRATVLKMANKVYVPNKPSPFPFGRLGEDRRLVIPLAEVLKEAQEDGK